MLNRIPLVFHVIIFFNFNPFKGETIPVNNSDNISRISSSNIRINTSSIINNPSSQTSESTTEEHLSSSDIAQRLSQAHFQFTLKMYRALVQEANPQDNIAFSPLLVSTLLTPTLLSAKDYANYLIHAGGANSRSISLRASSLAQQIKQVLSLSDLSENAAEAWHKATTASLQDQYYKNFLQAPRGILLLQKGILPKKLERSLQKWFGSAMRIVTQSISSLSVLNDLNRWTGNETNNKIKDFLQEATLISKRSVMLSPAATHSFWLHEFDPNKTYQKGLFYRTANDRFEIPMMITRMQIPLGYSQILEARVLELSFQVRRASLFLVLPDHMELALSALESNFTSENIRSLLSTLKTEVVNIRLPRFYIDSMLSLAKPLRNLGAVELFNQRRKTDDLDFYFPPDDFIHRVRVEIREKNEEGPPQTGGPEVNPGSGIKAETIGKFDEKYFEVDHPFIFFVWDYIASTIICMGRVVDPRVLGAGG